MCRNAPSQTTHPGPFSKVKAVPVQTQLDMVSRREMFVERPNVQIEHLRGQWTDSNGCAVNVTFSDVCQAQLTATLMKPNGHITDLNLHATSNGWQCGAAHLTAASEEQLWWMFRDGRISIWERGPATHLPQSSMISKCFVDTEEASQCTLSGCQSPIEAYFNPHQVGPRNSLPIFFLEDGNSHAEACHGLFKVDAVTPMTEEQSASSENASLIGNVWTKARHKDGCREVQDALGTGDNHVRAAIASELQGHIWDAVECPHANHVVQKCIVEMCPEALQFMIDELMSWNGAATYLAKHRYGCRVFERLLEHCRPDQIQEMVGEVLANVGALCTHSFGNYVLQHLFEYGTEDQRQQLAALLVPRISRLCADSRAAAVIAKALENAPSEERRCIARALLQDPDHFFQLASLRSGQCVVVAVLKMPGPEAAEARQLLVDRRGGLSSSSHNRAVLKCLGLVKPEVQQNSQRSAVNGGA